ncbi:hypothetical protein RCL1_006827 [Eukaryota sp. TZLM3-RCL]
MSSEDQFWKTPGFVWNHFTIKKAVIWLASKLNKPITFLERSDFVNYGMDDIFDQFEDDSEVTQCVFTDLLSRSFAKSYLPKKSTILIFSPHPDDDVICMGGTIHKLVKNGNNIHVAYQTSGSLAVFNKEVQRYLIFVQSLSNTVMTSSLDSFEKILHDIEDERPLAPECAELVTTLKGKIRQAEAISALKVLEVDREECPPITSHFLDMPFYKTGTVKKSPIGEADVTCVFDLLMKVQPQHIFIAGDMSDPHGTHELCYRAVRSAIGRYEETMDFEKVSIPQLASLFASAHVEPEHELPVEVAVPLTPSGKRKQALRYDSKPNFVVRSDFSFGSTNLVKLHHKAKVTRPLLWLYRGAWQEWNVELSDVFVELSQADLDRKIESIFAHQSQKDRAMFPGNDKREFWQRARDRNIDTANNLVALGLPRFFACEAFVVTYHEKLNEFD